MPQVYDQLRVPRKFSPHALSTALDKGLAGHDSEVVKAVMDALKIYDESAREDRRQNMLEIERFLQVGRGGYLPEVTGSYHGSIATGESTRYSFRRNTYLDELVLILSTAGSSTTTVKVYKNGSDSGASISLASSATFKDSVNILPKIQFLTTDLISFNITTAGTGAKDLQIIARGA